MRQCKNCGHRDDQHRYIPGDSTGSPGSLGYCESDVIGAFDGACHCPRFEERDDDTRKGDA